VAQPTEQEAREVFEARRLVEPPLLERFMAVATPADIAILAHFIAEEEMARTKGDLRHAIRMSGDFHLQIAERAGQQTLGRILRELVSRTSLILMTYSDSHAAAKTEATSCGCQEHRALLDAIRLRDKRESSRLMREHLDRLESQLQFTQEQDHAPDLLTLFGTPDALH
jgi:DNA-binding GntR family transcriptional regulator